MLKLGPHIRANNSNHDIDNLLFGIDWPVMTWHDNGSEWGRLNTYHANHPRTVIMGRIPAVEDFYKPKLGKADAMTTGTQTADMIISMGAPPYVYWCTDEINDIHAWSAAFHLAFLKRLNAAGFKGCGPKYAEGNPHVRRFDGFSDWPYHRDLMAYINEHAAQALACVNTYRKGDSLVPNVSPPTATQDDDAAHLYRYDDLVAYLDEWGYDNVRLVFGETGLEYPIQGATDDAQMVAHAKDINRIFNMTPRIIGGAWYDFSNLAEGYSAYGPDFLYPFLDWARAELASGGTTTPPAPSGRIRTTTSVNLRRKPVLSDAEIIKVLPPNYEMELAGPTSGDFVQVKSWLHKDYIKPA